ncbi:ImuA family protein, partial [Sphingobium chlorophenolicum]|uniref:ImuA family protein n=1 Tax=Sphingobium chlorophenolicum TaxID=46429 RepID=UPI0009DCB384
LPGRAGGLPYGPGLAALGIDPERLVIGVMADDAMLLRAAVDALRCPALGALAVELRGRAPLLDLTASRRLALAAEASGVTAFLLRVGGDPAPSAADTRWRVAAAPSPPLLSNGSGIGGPGMSAFDLHLLRRRSGRDGFDWRLLWDNERRIFAENGDGRDERHDLGQGGGRADGGEGGRPPPLSGAVVPVPVDRSAADRAA